VVWVSELLLTRAGLVTSAGVGAAPVLAAMDAGKPLFDDRATGLPWPTAPMDPADIPWPEGAMWANMRKYANGSAEAAVAVSLLAMNGAKPTDGAEALRSGVVIAVGCVGSDELGDMLGKIALRARVGDVPLVKLLYDYVPDYSYLRGIPSQIGQFVAIATGFRGSNVAVYGEGGAGGLGALALARNMVRSGELDRVFVVGVSPPLATGILTAYDHEDQLGTDASPGRGPFDSERSGAFPGQSAVAVIVERADAAGIFGAPAAPLKLESCGTLCAPKRADALAQAAREAMDKAAIRPDVWWSHASGSRAQDAEAVAAVAPQVTAPATSSRGTIGTSFECGGLVDVVLAAESLRRASVPPVGLLERPDPAFTKAGADIVTGSPRQVPAAVSTLVTGVSTGAPAATAGAAVLSLGGGR
jgi:3-oxoacyl-[acyl-carrier-protein] synthase II